MTILKTTLAATTAALLTLSGSAAFADAHALDLGAARLDTSLDTNGDGEVDDDEIIKGNMALFDADGDGMLNAAERDAAELMVMGEISADGAMATDAASGGMMIEFNVGAARLDNSLDTNGDGSVDDNEIIDGNMALFDTDGSGAINAAERNIAEELLRTGGSNISVDASSMTSGEVSGAAIDFDVARARLDTSLDTNGDGEVDNDEIIDGHMSVFDTDGSGAINAAERRNAEISLMNN